jgi:hypothetical protein
LGWVPLILSVREAHEPLTVLAWLARIALPAGALCILFQIRVWPYGLVAPAAWMGALVWADLGSPRDLSSPLWSACLWIGLFLAGAALARLTRAPLATAVWTWLVSLGLCALPDKAGLADVPWPADWARAFLDLSPEGWLAESAGARDWMWQRGHYAAVGVDRFQRESWRGELAGPLALVVGWLALGFAPRLRRGDRRTASSGP